MCSKQASERVNENVYNLSYTMAQSSLTCVVPIWHLYER